MPSTFTASQKATAKIKSRTLPQQRFAASTRKSASSSTCSKGPIKRFTTNGSPSVKTFVTSGLRVRNQSAQANDFSYDLSKDEVQFMDNFKSAMKTVPDQERQLLTNGERTAYLTQRYVHSPDCKYNYPEATSWRIGWLHNQLSQQRS